MNMDKEPSSAAQTTDKTGAGATPAAAGPKSETLVLRGAASAAPEDEFLDMLARVQGSRLEDQRSELPRPKPEPAKTVPDDDFFALLMRAQAGRMEDQRATIPAQTSSSRKGGSNPKK